MRALLCVVGVSMLFAGTSSAQSIFSGGHGDLAVKIDPQRGLDLHYHFDGSAVIDGVVLETLPMPRYEYEPHEIVTHLSEAGFPLPEGDEWSFTGAAAGEPLWLISEVQDFMPANPWLGIGTEEISPDEVIGDVDYRIDAIRGPGAVSIFGTGPLGESIVYVSSINDDLGFTLPAGTHGHFNIAFTQPGRYELDLTASVLLAPTSQSLQDSATFVFQVVPEPTTLGLVAGVAALVLRRR